MVGSAQAFLLLFSTKVYDYRNISECFYSMLRSLLMEFDFSLIRDGNPNWGPILFCSYIVLSVFVLLNMFIAIIGDAYTETR